MENVLQKTTTATVDIHAQNQYSLIPLYPNPNYAWGPYKEGINLLIANVKTKRPYFQKFKRNTPHPGHLRLFHIPVQRQIIFFLLPHLKLPSSLLIPINFRHHTNQSQSIIMLQPLSLSAKPTTYMCVCNIILGRAI